MILPVWNYYATKLMQIIMMGNRGLCQRMYTLCIISAPSFPWETYAAEGDDRVGTGERLYTFANTVVFEAS